MSLSELQASVDNISIWKAILLSFNPILVLVTLELLARTFYDDDDQDGGEDDSNHASYLIKRSCKIESLVI